ncbi:MAG: plasmid pRiA4b ORF-3 family protein [Elusimicrobia bacterium]|nr:MAG: plasmid pRiA4b ORF-3 family protein [Elusimicrobiota bacterium]KAF0152908.1 MAG: plasmid pRiA4b ORF-3 family protein [Elusimicrobiota bacterium]
MRTLEPDASFYRIRQFAEEAEGSAAEFAHAMDRFGAEPGDAWLPAADEFNERLAALRGELAGLRGKLSLPGAARKELAGRVRTLAAELAARREALRGSILDSCPPLGELTPPDAAAAAVWKEYKEAAARLADRVMERTAVQRLARRAYDPVGVFTLCQPQDKYLELPRYWEIFPALRDLLYHTPLPRLGGHTLLGHMTEKFRERVAQGGPADGLFARFVEGVASKDPALRKAARKELELARRASNEEISKGAKAGDFEKSCGIWGVWAGVKASLSEPDPARRRAALCALPELQFSLVTSEFPGECVEFIARALRDTDGMVRHKALRFGADFLRIQRVRRPEIVGTIESVARRLLSETKKKMPKAAAAARKLLKTVDWCREYDSRRGAVPDLAAGDGEAAGREVSFSIPVRRPYDTVFQFKVTLTGSRPPVWRRIQVPGSYTFYDLHLAIQNAMGWTDSHLHAFELDGGPRPLRIESPYAADELFEEAADFTTEAALSKYLGEGARAVYEYDFGDGWLHNVELEKILPKAPGADYPLCLEGRRACPPEDCGGLGGYGDCVRLAGGEMPFEDEAENERLKDWLGDWDPGEFDPGKVVFEDPRERFLATIETE